MLLVYCPVSTPRLVYIVQTMMNALGLSFRLTYNTDEYKQHSGPRLNYSAAPVAESEIWVHPADLLFQQDIQEQHFEVFQWEEEPAFFKTPAGTLPFDVLAAAFYLLTRYEEYLPHQLDEYGRYGHRNSLASKHNFLQKPLVNIWLQKLANLLQQQFQGIVIEPPAFNFIPTYDIDIALSYKGKGVGRNAGGLVKAIVHRHWRDVAERFKVLAGWSKDPFDVYDWLDALHTKHKISPLYFFLVAATTGRYDRNTNPENAAFKTIVKKTAEQYPTGIHPSWQSSDKPALLLQEIRTLESLAGKKITRSRQHYIRLTLPQTYQRLVQSGIQQDYSMGYGSINGFRASWALPYKWFDLTNDSETNLTLYPFCYMDANSLFEQHLTPAQAAEELEYYYQVNKQENGTMVTIFHNHLLTLQPAHAAWRGMYGQFLDKHFA